MIVENKPGAATATASTYVYRSASKDGTVLGMSLDMLPFFQTLFPQRVNFDMSKVQWIGNMATLNSVIAVSDRSPVKIIADMTKATAVLGSNGLLSQTYSVPALLNQVHGAKFKIVLGFQGTAQMDLAIERDALDDEVRAKRCSTARIELAMNHFAPPAWPPHATATWRRPSERAPARRDLPGCWR